MIKKWAFGFLAVVMACTITSCSFIRSGQLTALIDEEGQKIEEMSREIIRCFAEKDKNALKSLFCEQIRMRTEFDEQLDRAFAFMACDGYTDSEIDRSASGGESWEQGRRVKWYVIAEVPYVAFWRGEVGNEENPLESQYYGLNYYWCITNETDRSQEGLHYLVIELLNVDSMMLGERLDEGA